MTEEKNEIIKTEKDILRETSRALDYLEEHPGIGAALSGALTTGGVLAMIHYIGRIK